ncbi:hypothetical protein [Nonomuraea helvata]|uniref:Uncharacterized protein n=1 Tax=Nonomuraea helvata TaxID=37484 RepID=A0ABV5S0S2_9ACTN
MRWLIGLVACAVLADWRQNSSGQLGLGDIVNRTSPAQVGTFATRVTGRVVVYGLAGGEAAITDWKLVYKHQIHLIGLNIGTLVQAAPQIFGEVMAQLFELLAAGPPSMSCRSRWGHQVIPTAIHAA